MVDTKILKAIYVEKGLTQSKVAAAIVISPKTLSLKMNNKAIFGTDESEVLTKLLDITDPMKIFLLLK